MRRHARGQIQLLQILIAFFLAGKEFLNALQAFNRLGAHAVLHQDFRLQHQVLQGGGAQRRPFGLGGFGRRLRHAGKARGDDLVTVFIDLAAQHFQTLLVAGLVGIHIRGAIQAFGGLGIVAHAAVQIKKLEQSLAIVAFPIGGIEQLAHELQKIGRTAMLAHHILHHRDKSAAVSPIVLELLQLARQRNCLGILLRIHQQSDQVCHFLLAGRICLNSSQTSGSASLRRLAESSAFT